MLGGLGRLTSILVPSADPDPAQDSEVAHLFGGGLSGCSAPVVQGLGWTLMLMLLEVVSVVVFVEGAAVASDSDVEQWVVELLLLLLKLVLLLGVEGVDCLVVALVLLVSRGSCSCCHRCSCLEGGGRGLGERMIEVVIPTADRCCCGRWVDRVEGHICGGEVIVRYPAFAQIRDSINCTCLSSPASHVTPTKVFNAFYLIYFDLVALNTILVRCTGLVERRFLLQPLYIVLDLVDLHLYLWIVSRRAILSTLRRFFKTHYLFLIMFQLANNGLLRLIISSGKSTAIILKIV